MPDKKRRRHPAPPPPIDRPFPDLPSSIAREGSSSSVDEEVLAAACWIERYEVEAVAGPLPSAAELA
ncbi:MAG TPA: hypothetical protein VFQ39_07695, partial [Longimicrobium sp.]|nr:hypothetical protein [Longimicrobium sp.]